MIGTADATEHDPWNPGLSSSIPLDVLPLSTMFRQENVETGFAEAYELSDFSGLPALEIVVFRPERLLVHEVLIRVTTGLSVPDGPDYEELGLNLRAMVAKIYDHYIVPELASLKDLHEGIRDQATTLVSAELRALRSAPSVRKPARKPKRSLWQRLFGKGTGAEDGTVVVATFDEKLASLRAEIDQSNTSLKPVCRRALLKTVESIINHRGSLVGDDDVIVGLAVGMVLNKHSGMRLGQAIEPLVERAADAEGYCMLPVQENPVIMNVKGASAAGKSTIRPKQRELAGRLGVPWEDFALISPDYWRKYLLEYESLGDVYKYGAMLTGHELALIDKKLDRHMAEKARAGTMPHLLIDRFRFDSFNVGGDRTSQLLTRFGDMVYMFFMITPPEATIERAYKRGLTTGRYKAVDDLLDHNIEAYTGMPALFLSWALSEKRVHYEFLDNSVPLGSPPRTVAFGWNKSMVVFDVPKLLDIDRYRKIDVHATKPEEIYLAGQMSADENTEFLCQCAKLMETMRFADPQSGHVYGVLESGQWSFQDGDYLARDDVHPDTLAGLAALGWGSPEPSETSTHEPDNVVPEEAGTLGHWGRL